MLGEAFVITRPWRKKSNYDTGRWY